MRSLNGILALFVAMGLILSSCPSWAVHPWPMFHRNVGRTGQADVKGPRMVDIDWIVDFGANINYASPVIDENGRVYIGTTDGVLHVYNNNGSLAWTYNTGATNSTYFGGENTPSAAIAGDGHVYVLDATGRLHKLTSAGTLVWKYPDAGDPPVAWDTADSHPLILPNGDIVIAVYHYIISPLGADSYLVSIQPDRTVNWTISNPGAGHVLAGPAADSSGNIYVCAFASGSGKLFKYTSGGSHAWTFNNAVHVYNTPAITPDGHCVFMDAGGWLRAINNTTGNQDWFYRVGVFSTSAPAVASDGYVVGLANINFAAGLNASGTVRWEYDAYSYLGGGASLDSESVAYFGSYGDFGSESNMIHAIDKQGKVKWGFTMGYNCKSTPALDASGNLFIGLDTSVGGRLVKLNAVPSGVKTVGAAKALPNSTHVDLPYKPVTLVGDGFFYIQDWDPIAGIRVISSESVSVGDVVSVSGDLGIDGSERAIVNATVTRNGVGLPPQVRYFINRDVGGGTVGDNPGPAGGVGMNTVGLLVTTTGRVNNVTDLLDGTFEYWIDDGSKIPAQAGRQGIKVIGDYAPSTPYAIVTGVVSLENVSGVGLVRKLLTRDYSDVIEIF